MGVSGGVGIEEGPSLLQEIVELALLVTGAALLVGQSAGSSGGLQEDVSDTVKRNLLARAKLLLLLLNLLPA